MTDEPDTPRRIAAIADLHGFLPEIEPCDLLLVAGDICPVSDHRLEYQRWWLEGPFTEWLGRADAGQIVGIGGNHDFIAEADPQLLHELPWTYLYDETVEAAGFTVHGSPWTPTFMKWAFMEDEEQLATRWAQIPDETDILVTHGPPLGHGDLVVDGHHGGSETLLARVGELPRLRLHVFGHIHEAGGSRTQVDAAELVNVSYVDFDYQPARSTTLFEL